MRTFCFKILNILLIISICFIPSFVFALSESDVKSKAVKGDIYNPFDNTLGSSAVISVSNGEVDIEKRVVKVNNEGLYNVSFWIKGDKVEVSKTKDTYVVFVIDRSYTMRLNNRWIDAKNAVINMSEELSKVDGIKMALIGFSGGKASDSVPFDDAAFLRGTFSNNAFTDNEFGNYDTDNTNAGGTNIEAGLLKAKDLLSNKNGNKYVILLSDGVPTFYYDENGNTVGPGNSNEASLISQVPVCKNEAINAANSLKESATIYTIGYDLDHLTNNFNYNGMNFDEKTLAIETLRGIASSGNCFLEASSSSNNTIASELEKIHNEMITFPVGTSPDVNDGIGSSFKLNLSSSYGGNKVINTDDSFVINDYFKKIGDFDISIDKAVDTGWYETNDSFSISYKDVNKDTKTISCDINPEVYWVNKYKYKVNYYKDEITNVLDKTHFINGYSDEEDNGEVIYKEKIDLLKYVPLGYYFEGMYNEDGTSKIDSLTIDKNSNNIINILYKKKKFNYIVNYYYSDINGNYNDPDIIRNIKDVEYGTVISTSDYYLDKDEIRKGYYLDKDYTKETIYRIDKEGIVIDIYYKKKDYSYVTSYKLSNKSYDNNIPSPPYTGVVSNIDKSKYALLVLSLGLIIGSSIKLLRKYYF